MATKTYFFGAYKLVLDSEQIFPDDPGQGTPAMVYGPKDKLTATYWCAADTGELDCGSAEIPDNVMKWLHSMDAKVDAFMAEHTPKETVNGKA